MAEPSASDAFQRDLALEQARVGTFAWTRQGGVHGDARFRELLGISSNEPDDSVEHFVRRLHAEDRERVRSALLEVLETGAELETTFRVPGTGEGTRQVSILCSISVPRGTRPAQGVGLAFQTSAESVERARVAHVMDNLASGFLTIDHEWRFTYVNAEGQRLLKSESLLGRSVWEAFPEQIGTPFEFNYRRAAETGEPVHFRAYYPFPLNTWYEVRMHTIPDGLAVQFLDVTAEHEQQERMRKQARRSGLLAQVSHELSHGLDAERALARLMPLVVPALADWGLVIQVDQGVKDWRERVRPVAWTHADRALAAKLDTVVPLWAQELPDSAELGAVISTQRHITHLVTAESLQANTRPGRARELFRVISPGSVATIPLVADGHVLAILVLCWNAVDEAPDDELETAIEIAARAALLLDNARLYEAQRDQAAEMEQALLTDPLTGLPNRRLLNDRVEQAAHRSKRFGHAVAVVFVDLDRFKRVNDDYGHAAGDALLVAVAGRLSAQVRATDTLARVSGDEFVVLCENLHDPDDAGVLAERIVTSFREPFLVAGLTLLMTASVGIAYAGPDGAVDDGLIIDADTAMYQAKRAGGSVHRVIDRRLAQQARDQDHLEDDLYVALAQGGLHLAYQPIVTTRTGEMTGVEALLRWDHPTRGPISALTAISAAERSGLILELGAWALDQACRDWGLWRTAHPEHPLDLSVNLSVRQLMAPTLFEMITRTLATTGMDASALILEVTEGIFIDDSEAARDVLTRLKGHGIRLALDDFGTGYSSLSYLQRFPVDIVKVDRTFVNDIDLTPKGAAFVEAITQLAHLLDMSVTAEGVETRRQLEHIRAAGSECAQGYLLSRPVPRQQIFELLAAGGRLPVERP